MAGSGISPGTSQAQFHSWLSLATHLLVEWAMMVILLLVQGFDEYMNLVLDDAEEVSVKRKTRKSVGEEAVPVSSREGDKTHSSCKKACCTSDLAITRLNTDCLYCAGRILLKGDNITLMQTTCASSTAVLQKMAFLRYTSLLPQRDQIWSFPDCIDAELQGTMISAHCGCSCFVSSAYRRSGINQRESYEPRSGLSVHHPKRCISHTQGLMTRSIVFQRDFSVFGVQWNLIC